MFYPETKVYFDGSHYVAIPHTEKPYKPRPKPSEQLVTVIEEDNKSPPAEVKESEKSDVKIGPKSANNCDNEEVIEESKIEAQTEKEVPKTERKMTRREIFNELYCKTLSMSKTERRNSLIKSMLPYFRNADYAERFVDNNLRRKRRNLICRRIRMTRKANLANFNYFCTFTYSDEKHTEVTFKKQLQNCFRNLCYRKGWKYMGVWERSPEKQRLHFHGLFNIPDGAMVGELVEKTDYSFKSQNMRTTLQNTYFNERFGRSDFESINAQTDLCDELAYIMKYLEKTDERIVYSKGLAQYFISDIMDEDVISTMGVEDNKLLLADDFRCWDEGVLIGKVSKETIEQMRKSN
jgi:hypothetical protein